MHEKTPVANLEIGMYVTALDRSWLETDFLFQGFLINSKQEIDAIKVQCNHVYIDIEKSTNNQERKLFGFKKKQKKPSEQACDNKNPLPRQKSTKFEEEYTTADHIYDDVYLYVNNMMLDITNKKSINIQNIKGITGQLIGSLLRNSDALIWFTKLKRYDSYTYHHTLNVSIYMIAFAKFMGLSDEDTQFLGMVGLLQDIGKAKMPSHILDKSAELTSAEKFLCQSHVQHSIDILTPYKTIPEQVLQSIYSHHERHDGQGYPRGLSGTQIPQHARIAGLIDTYDAMTSDRPYAPALSPYTTISQLRKTRGTAFPEQLVDKLIEFVGVYAVGSIVELNTGEIGIIVKQSQEQRLKPHVQIILDVNKEVYPKKQIIDLASKPVNRFGEAYLITRVLDPHAYDIDISTLLTKLH